MDHPEIRQVAALEQEILDYRYTIGGLQAEIRRLKAELDEARGDGVSTFSEWLRALTALARATRRASRYRSRLARVLEWSSEEMGTRRLMGRWLHHGCVWSRRALDKKGE